MGSKTLDLFERKSLKDLLMIRMQVGKTTKVNNDSPVLHGRTGGAEPPIREMEE